MNRISVDEVRIVTDAISIIRERHLLDDEEIERLGKRTLKLALQEFRDLLMEATDESD